VPYVLTDVQADINSAETINRISFTGPEITEFIKYPVVGQTFFVIDIDKFAV
jgi:hypothetical protein